MLLDAIVNDVLGVPWALHGETKLGFDCYGLVRYVYKQLGYELPKLHYTMEVDNRNILLNNMRFSEYFEDVENPQPLDIAIISYYHRPVHVGLYLGEGQILHTTKGSCTHIKMLTDMEGHLTMKEHIEGYSRPKGLIK